MCVRPPAHLCVCAILCTVQKQKVNSKRNVTKASKQQIITVIIYIDPSFDFVLVKIEVDYHFTPLSCVTLRTE